MKAAYLDQFLCIAQAVGDGNVEGDAFTAGASKHLEGRVVSGLDRQVCLLEAIKATRLLKHNPAHGLTSDLRNKHKAAQP